LIILIRLTLPSTGPELKGSRRPGRRFGGGRAGGLHTVAYYADDTNYPPALYVEDVVTLATPHHGTPWYSAVCQTTQCTDMFPNSFLMHWLHQGPESTQGTDWTLTGSYGDGIVDEASAGAWDNIRIDYNIGHRHKYPQGINHATIIHTTGGVYTVESWHHYARTWKPRQRAGGLGRHAVGPVLLVPRVAHVRQSVADGRGEVSERTASTVASRNRPALTSPCARAITCGVQTLRQATRLVDSNAFRNRASSAERVHLQHALIGQTCNNDQVAALAKYLHPIRGSADLAAPGQPLVPGRAISGMIPSC
jgi:hypothetical protein